MSNILVIDDEESLRFTFARFLSGGGYHVVTAGDYIEASAAIAQKDFDLVFADIILGGKTGLDILREVKERNPACPVVMITGCPEIATASDAVRLGAFDYIPKPVQKDALLRVAALALQHKKDVDEKERYRSNLEAIFKSVRDAIITVDKEMSIVEVNEAAKNIYGLSRDDAGKRFDSFQKGCNGKCLEALAETIEKKLPIEVCRHECQFNNQERRVVSLTTSPLLDHKGAFSGAVMVVRDETRLADLERNLEDRRQFHHFVGGCGNMQKVYSLIEDLANVESTVLVTGESGTGKELVAEALHDSGERKDKPLVKVNCSALPESLLESELFGHVKGAFTGAIRDKQGRFQLAQGGTIFLDEIGDISPRVQQRLLRVLQQKEFERVGDSTPLKADVRVIAATNKNLREKVKTGEFREDLYYRLNVVAIALPPLRDRREDIPLLADVFIKKLNMKLGKEITGISDDVLKIFMNHSWPGNVRQLEHVLEHACILCRQNAITIENLPADFMDSIQTAGLLARDGRADERGMILQALEKAGGNKAKTAKLLGISRRTIYRKMQELHITSP
ncbi:MAG TPA: sigma 54-interacting transcriptional regulator [Nitrospirota bacterium]